VSKEKRRPSSSYRRKRANPFIWIIGLLAVGLVALWGFTELTRPSRTIANLETFASEGQAHVADGTVLTYKTDPPTSGDHYATAVRPNFYTEQLLPGNLVHSLEHGHIVIYYNPTTTPAEVVQTLKTYPVKYPGAWDGVVVAPREQTEAVVLTAWRNMLRMPTWDHAQAEAFMDAFRGRGPENPVR
jgi:hypothetical protein